MSTRRVHETHSEIVKRLRRAQGHLTTTIGMIEQGRPCVDLAQQLHAVEKAITSAKRALIHDHIDHCLDQGAGADARSARSSIEEFKALSKYL